MMNNQKTIYFFEGETEQKLINTVKLNDSLPNGKAQKFNLWQKRLQTIARTINKTDRLLFVIDTDAMEQVTKFIENIKWLNKHKYKYCLIIQRSNLEDELVYSCGKANQRALFTHFYNAHGADEFKNSFNNDRNLEHKLISQNFDQTLLWSRPQDFCQFITTHNLNCGACDIDGRFIKLS